MTAATLQIDGKPPAPKIEPKKEHLIDEEKLFESLQDQVRQDYLNKQESD